MKTIALSVYLILGLSLITKVGLTVYQLSSVMHHNAIVAQLQTEKNTFVEQKQDLQTALSSETSLQSMLLAAEDEYVDITQPMVVEDTTIIASQY